LRYAARAFLHILAALDECRRIDDHDVEFLARFAQSRKRIEGVVAQGTHGEAVGRCRPLQQLERWL
jgi:hypothetical protein